MATKVNLVLDDEVKEELDRLVPAGERSHFANEALRLRLSLLRRSQAAEKLEALRLRGPHLPTREVVDSLRATRDKA